ncbi:hypothetical protein RD110_15745 [Rhodoferax koreense]|uniref:Uncharacterized protein n=1 Tax=Rhodoferax koreensis TaxID=1842727 RepID=A0A1P8JXI1_9BURK|nr:hypothetical protein [Rhodoferax koreense]APW38474.1 hypothetical protein RD110_15745 [Rhodoferax koreense]
MPHPDEDFSPQDAFARGGITSPFGKLTQPLKTHVDENTETEFMRRATAIDQVPGERLRDLVYLDVHGMTYLEMVAKHRRDLLDQQGTHSGRDRTKS